jgi:hypothetical protein
MKKILSSIILVAFMFVSLIGGQSVRASDNVATPTIPLKPVAKIVPHIIDFGNGTILAWLDGNADDKDNAVKAADSYMNDYVNRHYPISADGYKNADGTYSLLGWSGIPYNDGKVTSYFLATADKTYDSTLRKQKSSILNYSGHGVWTGHNPSYADYINLFDLSFIWNGSDLSTSWTWTPGPSDSTSFSSTVSISGNTGTISLHSTQNLPNTYYLNVYTKDEYFTGDFLNSLQIRTTVEYKFGNNFYFVTSNDSVQF